MQLIINTYGAYLHVKDDIFEVKVDGKKNHISPKKVQSVLITTGASLSSDAVKLAVENNIDILFLERSGKPYGRIWHDKLGSTARIRHHQLKLADTETGLEIGKQFIQQKFENQIRFLKELRKRRTRNSVEITEAVQRIKSSLKDMKAVTGVPDDRRGTIMGIEGNAGRVYWNILSKLMPKRFQFSGRSRNPARDEFNCLLNYAYGVLYGIVERACVLSGIDPYVGFIHTDHYAKTSMVFDVIEGYRIYAEETVLQLFSQKKVKKTLFDSYRKGLTLNKEGKIILMTDYNEFLDQKILYRSRKIKRRSKIQFDLHTLANSWIK
ncbi:MAG: CRISPR-associated endonuclease Cas1 [Candidatus Marinimicrobia bacterium]|nr:CRISPR-associated endonuclease Cas1 [Candidatus Neomarinimicrobiota bacterium]